MKANRFEGMSRIVLTLLFVRLSLINLILSFIILILSSIL